MFNCLHLHFYVGTQSGFLHICVLANCLIGPPNCITETLKRHLPLAFCTFMVSFTLVCSLHPLQPNICGQKEWPNFSYLYKFSLMTENKSHPPIQVLEYFRTQFLTMKHSVISNILNNDKLACVRLPACTCIYGRLVTHLCSVMGMLTQLTCAIFFDDD
jgi:hypothetical protein